MSDKEKLRVLVVDDEIRMGRVFEDMLGENVTMSMVTSVEEAQRIIQRESFDVVICDIHLRRGAGGAELLNWLEKEDAALAERVLLMTGGLYSDASQELAERVANPIVYKPFDPEELWAHLERLTA